MPMVVTQGAVCACQGVTAPYLAVPVSGEEHNRVNREHPVGLVGRLLMGLEVDPETWTAA